MLELLKLLLKVWAAVAVMTAVVLLAVPVVLFIGLADWIDRSIARRWP